MPEIQVWCRVALVGPGGTVLESRVLRGDAAPDLQAVDAVARLALAAGRVGGRVVVADVSPEMGELLDLAGLGVEVQR